jgi:two-component system CheB/CheR fusion protein
MSAKQPHLIVGIGASAGGLDALQHLFAHLPDNTGMSFLVVTHLPADHKSHLAEILRRYTEMDVTMIERDTEVRRNVVFVAPPDSVVLLEKNRFHLAPRGGEPMHKPIDVFFSSLARHSGEEAIGVVLSGTGSDGTLGIKAIKERGGLTLAQGSEGSTPEHHGMPDAAIASGLIDLVLPIQEIGAELGRFASGFVDAAMAAAQTVEAPESYSEVYGLLLRHVGHDFSGYKLSTFHRRVHRRMQICRVATVEEYVELLRADTAEVTLLFRELLIGVTSFFRDNDAFDVLATQVIPKILEGKGSNESVRLWVPGCATGEEAYSLAIMVRECLDTLKVEPRVQIFASDIDEKAVSIARQGRYPKALMDSVSPERRARFFTEDGVSYVVNREIRSMCLFSPHSVLRDQPFSRIDLISCRNLLIYFGAEFQSQVMPIFHFALRPGGYLFLGLAENIGSHSDLFAAVDRKQRIFQKRDHSAFPRTPIIPRAIAALMQAPPLEDEENQSVATLLRHAVDRRVMERYAPAHVLVNRDGDIIFYSARTGKYLEPPGGVPTRHLLTQTRRDLRPDLRAALQEALETLRRVERRGIVADLDDRTSVVDLSVEPFGNSPGDPLFLVVFRDVGEVRERTIGPIAGDERVEQLERTLRETRERLQSEIEEHESALEELKSSNEELHSSNEELQSSNEELETAKEELQSLNEELHTINAELMSKVDALDHANADLVNVFDSTKVAIVFLDQNVVIRNFTPAATEIFNLIPSDAGRPLSDISGSLEDRELHREIREVAQTGAMIERNVRRADGKATYSMRILPYRAPSGRSEGVLVTFVDVTNSVEAEARQRVLVEELNHRVRNMLTVVNSIANQTLRQSTTKEDFVAAFTGRIRAMGAAYTVVAQRNWGDVLLRDIALEQIKPFVDGKAERMKMEGPAIRFSPTAALSFSLVLHELIVNAVKYGALAGVAGSVDLVWKRKGSDALELSWSERGGPTVAAPTRRGFGSELIKREIQRLGGTYGSTYEQSGFRAVLTIPLDESAVQVHS